ncbi:hypothetical protein HK103_007424 [Boothiomyces macroporosus]|uniref:Uncharacterized protein n=1 Tax=Boothiomyces macroporosus TaxID=261099 RepID=A0AAD5UKU4_9FUNG|nr:hypothetical protein HK103_007424 [Boothiomyces macroporosus]
MENRPVSSDSTILSESTPDSDRVSHNTVKSVDSGNNNNTIQDAFNIKSALNLLDSAIDNSDFLIDLFPEPTTHDSKISYNRKSTLDNVDVTTEHMPLPPVQLSRSKSDSRKHAPIKSNTVKKSVEPIAKTVGAIRQKVHEYTPSFHGRKSEHHLEVGSPLVNGNHMPHMSTPMVPLNPSRVASPDPSVASGVTSSSTLIPPIELSSIAMEISSSVKSSSDSGPSINMYRTPSPLASISQKHEITRPASPQQSTLYPGHTFPRSASPISAKESPKPSSLNHIARAPSPISYNTYIAQKGIFDPQLPAFQSSNFVLPDFGSFSIPDQAQKKPAQRSKTVGAKSRDSHLILSSKFKSESNIRKDFGPSTAPIMSTELHSPQPSQLYYSPQFSTAQLDYHPPVVPISTSVVSKPPQIYSPVSPGYASSESSTESAHNLYAGPFPFSQLGNVQPSRNPDSAYTVSPIQSAPANGNREPPKHIIPPRNHKQVVKSNQKSIFWCI